MRSPFLSRSRIRFSSSCRSTGIISLTGCPTASSAVYSKMRSAAAFQLVMIPSRFLEMMASSDDSTMDASQALSSSGRFCSATSLVLIPDGIFPPPFVGTEVLSCWLEPGATTCRLSDSTAASKSRATSDFVMYSRAPACSAAGRISAASCWLRIRISDCGTSLRMTRAASRPLR